MSAGVERHYARPGLLDAVRTWIADRSCADVSANTRDTAAFDEFHVGGRRATSKMIAFSGFRPEDRVLDVGSGLGGPARHLAGFVGCHVTGLDLTSDFCAAAEALSRWSGQSDRTRFVRGDACRLPFRNRSFDGAWLQHVTMNVGDKFRLAGEAARVLKPGAVLAFYEAFLVKPGGLRYPVPWAGSEPESRIGPKPQFLDALTQAGFQIDECLDESSDAAASLERALARFGRKDDPVNALVSVLGDQAETCLTHLLEALRSGSVEFTLGRAVRI